VAAALATAAGVSAAVVTGAVSTSGTAAALVSWALESPRNTTT